MNSGWSDARLRNEVVSLCESPNEKSSASVPLRLGNHDPLMRSYYRTQHTLLASRERYNSSPARSDGEERLVKVVDS